MIGRDRSNLGGSLGMSGHNFDAFVSSQRSYHHDTDWAVKLQEKYWRARQKFLAKIERREDSCIVLSDSKLDAKLDIYKSIDKSCARLTDILENYQNALFMLSNEENALGILLKECAKHDKTKAGKIMSITGKSLTQSSHQRIRLYMPLLRLFQEMETFHSRAVDDTSETVDKLESKRAQYRSSLLWMKDISEKLDPDVYRQLDKFRRVQTKVRDDKKVFDAIQMDVVQKIDLLMASRCNLMNQILSPYQSILLETFEKNSNNFRSVEDLIKQEDLYDYEFKTLKQLNPLKLDSNETHRSCDNEVSQDPQKQTEEEPNLLIDAELDSLGSEVNNNVGSTAKISNLKLITDEMSQLNDALVDITLDSEPSNAANETHDQLLSEVNDLYDDTNDLFETLFGKKPADTGSTSKLSPDMSKCDSIVGEDVKTMRANLDANLLDTCDDEQQQIASLLGFSELSVKKHLPPIKDSSSSSSGPVDLMGDEEVPSTSNTPANRQLTIDELLSNELEDIDNSSYFKSLQGLQL